MDREAAFLLLITGVNEVGGYEYQPSEIDRSLPMTAYGVDSLNVMQVLASIEARSGLVIDHTQLSEFDFASIDSLLDHLMASA